MEYFSQKMLLFEVLDFFIRGNEGALDSIKESELFFDTLWQLVSQKEMEEAVINESEYYGIFRSFNKLSFIVKAKLILPKIFDITQEECSKIIRDSVAKARLKLMEKSGKLINSQTLEDIKSSWAKEYTKEVVENEYQDLEKYILKEAERYESCRTRYDEAPETIYYNRYVEEWKTVVETYEKALQIYEHNKEAIQEMRETEDDLYFIQNDFIISPLVFKENNLGFDLNNLKFNKEFAKAYARNFDYVKTDFSKLKPWELELCRLGGFQIKRSYKKKIGEPDKYGNVQVSIFNNPDVPDFNDESE